MNQEEIAKVCRTVEERLAEAIEVQPGIRVQQCQWVWGKHDGEANLINVVCSIDTEMINQPILTGLDGTHDVAPDQEGWDTAFDNIVSGTSVDEHEDALAQARQEALDAAKELEGDF